FRSSRGVPRRIALQVPARPLWDRAGPLECRHCGDCRQRVAGCASQDSERRAPAAVARAALRRLRAASLVCGQLSQLGSRAIPRNACGIAYVSRALYFAFGNVTIDDLVFADGTTMWRVPGGNSIYAALGMALWGERPEVVAPIGPDYPIAKLRDRIEL